MSKLFLLVLVLFNVYYSIESQRFMRTSDIIPSFRARRSGYNFSDYDYEKFTVLGQEYTATAKRTVRSVPVVVMGDEGVEKREANGEHELYYDDENGAAFTISKRNLANGEVERSFYGTVVKEDGAQLVLQPSYDYSKRSDDFEPLTKIVERNFSTDYYRKRDYDEYDYYDFNTTKRATKGAVNNYVELAMIADYEYFKSAKDYLKTTDTNKVITFIEAYFVQLATLTSQIYERSLANTPSLKIKVVPKVIYVLTSESVSGFTSSSTNQMKFNGKSVDDGKRIYTDYKKVLKEFTSWTKTNLKNVDYDSAVLLTGTNLAEKSTEYVVGYAPIAGSCSKERNAVLSEDFFNYAGYFTIAHELGHNLGLDHDEDNNPDGNPECTDDASYLMATSAFGPNRLNNYKLSPCSVKSLVQFIYNENGLPCLADKEDIPEDLKKFIDFFPGQVFPLTDRCKKEFRENSYPIFEPEFDICEMYTCKYIDDNGRSGIWRYSTFEKTTCGSGKWCVAGVCTEDSRLSKGECIVPTDQKYCKSMEDNWGRKNVCKTFGQSVCCEYCNKNYKTVSPATSKTLKEWLDIAPTSSVTKL